MAAVSYEPLRRCETLLEWIATPRVHTSEQARDFAVVDLEATFIADGNAVHAQHVFVNDELVKQTRQFSRVRWKTADGVTVLSRISHPSWLAVEVERFGIGRHGAERMASFD